MKKLFAIMALALLLTMSIAAAEEFSYGVPAKAQLREHQDDNKSIDDDAVDDSVDEIETEDAYGKELTIRNTYQYESEEAEKAMAEAKLRIHVEGEIPGLENAYVHAESPEALERIQANMERFQNRFQYKYENMNATSVGNQTYLKAQRQARFLIFQFNIEDDYVLDEDGNLVAEQRGLLSRIFARERIN